LLLKFKKRRVIFAANCNGKYNCGVHGKGILSYLKSEIELLLVRYVSVKVYVAQAWKRARKIISIRKKNSKQIYLKSGNKEEEQTNLVSLKWIGLSSANTALKHVIRKVNLNLRKMNTKYQKVHYISINCRLNLWPSWNCKFKISDFSKWDKPHPLFIPANYTMLTRFCFV
jgi:hypothetical protein